MVESPGIDERTLAHRLKRSGNTIGRARESLIKRGYLKKDGNTRGAAFSEPMST
jgi:hypothetical protein